LPKKLSNLVSNAGENVEKDIVFKTVGFTRIYNQKVAAYFWPYNTSFILKKNDVVIDVAEIDTKDL